MEKPEQHVIVQTPRLILRRYTQADVDHLVELDSDPEVMRYLTGGQPTPRQKIADEIIPHHLAVYARLDRLGHFAAESAGTGQFLGWFHFRPGPGSTDLTDIELGYRLRRAAWRRGYATEGSRALIDLGFTQLGVQRVFAHAMTVNAASRRVMEKCGLTLVRAFPYTGGYPVDGAAQGEVEYALTRAQWEQAQRQQTRAADASR